MPRQRLEIRAAIVAVVGQVVVQVVEEAVEMRRRQRFDGKGYNCGGIGGIDACLLAGRFS
jgi:hypothetical protein